MLAFENRGVAAGLNGLVEARSGDLWLNATHGIVRVPAVELQTALAKPGYRMKSELVTEGEFAGVTVSARGEATAARDVDGNLWFATRNGVIHLDPEHRFSDIRPPVVSIRAIAADRVPLGADRTFAPHPRTLEIRYFGVHLTDPDRVVYRYRLAGLEETWQDVGSRTEAFYTRLAPGTYTFQVMASSGNDVWTRPLSSEPFTVLPSFYQTAWFRVLCSVAALALIFVIITLRVRALARGIRARAEERADERIRIARELHDGIVQSVMGVQIQLHALAARLSARSHPIAADLARLASVLRDETIGLRELMHGMQPMELDPNHFVDTVAATIKRFQHETGIATRFITNVDRMPLPPRSCREIAHVVHEALVNIRKHADASQVKVALTLNANACVLSIDDDGEGFQFTGLLTQNDAAYEQVGPRVIRDRVRLVGGELQVVSAPRRGDAPSGAHITISIPLADGYAIAG